MNQGELSGRVALVTGGGSGIGRATVARLSQAGASVVFTDIAEPKEAMERPASDGAGEVRFMRADAKIEADAARAVEETVAAFGRLDIAVNNVGLLGAGDSAKTPLHELELSAWNGTLEQSLTTCMLGMKHALRVMLPARQGSIVNISSLVGMHVTPYGSYAYHAAKAGVIHLTRAAGVLYAKQGVRVNVVSPGLVLTPKTTLTLAEREQIVNDFHPSGQMVTPEEIAQAVAWLASDSSSGVTGLNLPVDGGWAAR